MSLACWGYFVNEQGPHTPPEEVARLPCHLTTPGGSTLLMCGFDPHGLDCKKVWAPSYHTPVLKSIEPKPPYVCPGCLITRMERI
jgi:hypothetical protein